MVAESSSECENAPRPTPSNHVFGHSTGDGHVSCGGNGQLAPAMMQQTKGLAGCKANAWPYPKA